MASSRAVPKDVLRWIRANPDLPKNKQFNINVKPPKGAIIRLQRTTPIVLNTVNDLN